MKNKISLNKKNTILIKGGDNDYTNTIYFITYISIFQLALKYIILASILLLLAITIISIISFIILFYNIILFIIYSFINPNNIKGLAIDYLAKNIIRCTKNNYSDDKYYILTCQRQNLLLFNIGAYTIYLFIIYFLFFIAHVFYARITNKNFVGDIKDIDPKGNYIILFLILLVYSAINFGIYKYFFKYLVYIPYKDIDNRENEIDNIIDEFILIKVINENNEKLYLVDDNFFEILFDFSRIDELNNIFLNGIKTKNIDNCLEQKIIIYNLYMYLREYITFDTKMQDKFKKYCSNDINNKPYYDNTENRISFLSLLNNNEVKMIKKYHEELDFYNNIPDENIEYYNILNKNIDKKIRYINTNIITYNKTLIPFFIYISYIIIFLILNLIILYMVINYLINIDDINDNIKFFAIYIKSIYTYIYNYFYNR